MFPFSQSAARVTSIMFLFPSAAGRFTS
jgi:hypothetical protein